MTSTTAAARTLRPLGLAAYLCIAAGCGGDRPAAAAGTPPPPAAAAAAITNDQPTQDVPPATAQSSGALSPAKWTGYGATTFGMTPTQAKDAWGSALDGAPGKDSTCFQMTPAAGGKAGAGVRLMFEDDKLVRYDVRDADAIAPGGGQVGQDLPALVTRYGSSIVQQPHKYVAGASNVRIPAPDGPSVLVLETDASQHVVAWRVGLPPQVDYVEGCG